MNITADRAIVDSILHPRCAVCTSIPFPGRQWIFNGEENPLPATGDAAYRKHAGRGPSDGHKQHAQKFGKNRALFRRYIADRQTDRPTDRHTHHNTSQRLPRAK